MKEREKFETLIKDIQYDATIDYLKFEYLANDHPMRETSTIIDEYFYDNDTDRILAEMKHNTSLELVIFVYKA